MPQEGWEEGGRGLGDFPSCNSDGRCPRHLERTIKRHPEPRLTEQLSSPRRPRLLAAAAGGNTEEKGMTLSEDPPTKAVDIYRDTWVRFLGKYFIV